jgi:hypothetical protein
MALTISQAGSATSTTSSSTLVVTPTVSFSANDGVLVCIAADNSTAQGGLPFSSVTDSQSNTYTLVRSVKQQGASQNNLACGAIYFCVVQNALSVSDSITVNLLNNTTAKAAVTFKIGAAANKKPSQISDNVFSPTGDASSSSRSTTTMTSGDALVFLLAIENNGVVTGDSDTTRGSWSSAYVANADSGTALTSMQAFSQYKIVTGNGTQTWDTTFPSSSSFATAYATFREVAALSTFDRTATGSGTGTATAATKVTQLRLGIHTDFSFGFINGAGRFYIGPPTIVRTATGLGTGAGSATKKIVAVRTATGSGIGTSNNAIVHGLLRTAYGSGGASTGDNGLFLVKRLRTATASGAGSSSSAFSVTKIRVATGSGIGSSAIVVTRVVLRTSSGQGIGGSSTTRILVALRTGTGSGAGTQTSVGARTLKRACTGSGSGSGTADWLKSHIFRVPTTRTYPFAERLSEEAPDRLFSHTPQGIRAKNLYRLSDGTYTTTDPRRPELITRTYYGGHDIFLTDEEVTELTAAGYGASIT